MAGTGRCAGCGETDSLTYVYVHTLSCEKFAGLVRESPSRALEPAAEYERWRREDRDAERGEQRAGKVADTDERRANLADRYRTRSILEDE